MTAWHHTPISRLVTAAVVGGAVGVCLAPMFGTAAGVLAGWAAASLWLSIWIVLVTWRMNPAETRAHALREFPGRRTARAIALVGSVVSLAAVGVVVVQGHSPSEGRAYVYAGIAVVSVAASWLLIQVEYMLRYARMFYADDAGGIDFNDPEPPQYTDFAYFSVGLGMTYQVADTNVKTKELRKVVIGQTMLAYLFGAVILGTVINLVTGLA